MNAPEGREEEERRIADMRMAADIKKQDLTLCPWKFSSLTRKVHSARHA